MNDTARFLHFWEGERKLCSIILIYDVAVPDFIPTEWRLRLLIIFLYSECQHSPLRLFEIFAEELFYLVEGDYFQIIIQIYVVGTGNNQ